MCNNFGRVLLSTKRYSKPKKLMLIYYRLKTVPFLLSLAQREIRKIIAHSKKSYERNGQRHYMAITGPLGNHLGVTLLNDGRKMLFQRFQPYRATWKTTQ